MDLQMLLNLLRNSLLFISIAFLYSCKNINKKEDDFHQIINQNFFQFVDSSAYLTGRLIQIPFNNEKIITHQQLCITVDSVQMLSNRLISSINLILQKNSSTEFKKLIFNDNSLKLDTIELSKIKNIGRFELLQPIGNKKRNVL